MALLTFLLYYLGEEIISKKNFFEINFTIHDSKIKEIYLCDSIGSKILCGILFLRLTLTSTWFLLLIDSWLIFKQLIFVRKSSTHFLKLLQRIFNYFSKINFSKFRKKNILPVIVIFVLDSIKTSVQGTPKNNFLPLIYLYICSIVNIDCVLNTPLNCQSSIFSNYNDQSTNVLNQKTNVFFNE